MADNQVELVKQKTEIVSLIDSRVKLVKAGRNYKASCPFHGEKTPSFFVSPELQTFKCFGCGESGDVYSFLQKYEGMTFPDALEFLAKKAGMKLKRNYRTGDEQKRERLLEVLNLTSEYYHYLLTEHKVGRRVLSYLKNRGISKSLIETFGLGYSPDSWDGLQKYLVGKKKYTVQELLDVGLVLRQRGRSGYYDRFRGRLMFPLTDMRGKIVGFSGRVLPGEGVDEKQAKYINSPETKLYHKGKLLYGLSVSRGDIRRKDKVVVVEGELDMISSYKAGVREVVAVKGSALTEDQVTLLRRLTSNLVLALDADAAGSEATKRGIAVADKLGMNLSVVEVVEGKDPDEVAQKNPKLWRDLVDKPVSIYDYLIDRAVEVHGVSTGMGKKKVTKEVAPVLANITNAVEREHYLKQVAQILGAGENVLEREVLKVETLGDTGGESEIEPETIDRKEKLERYLTSLLLQMDRDLREKVGMVDNDWFGQSGIKSLWVDFGNRLKKNEKLKVKDLATSLAKEKQRLVESLFTSEAVEFKNDQTRLDRAFEKGVQELKKTYFKEEMIRLGREISILEDKKKMTSKERARLARLQQEFNKVTQEMKGS